MRAHAFEKELESHLPGVDVTVFSRVREFEDALKDRPEGVVSLRPVLEGLGLRPELQGYAGGKATERYVLIASDRAVSVAELSGKTLGAVDVLGRRNMDRFIAQLLGGVSPKLKHVTHERDLLPLLQFNAVAAVVTSETWADLLRQKTKMSLKTTVLQNEVGLCAVAFASPQAKSSLEPKIKAAGGKFNQALGVSQWR